MPLGSIPSTTKNKRTLPQLILCLQLTYTLKMSPGVVAHACNPSPWETETRGSRFAASLSYLVRPVQRSEILFQNKE